MIVIITLSIHSTFLFIQIFIQHSDLTDLVSQMFLFDFVFFLLYVFLSLLWCYLIFINTHETISSNYTVMPHFISNSILHHNLPIPSLTFSAFSQLFVWEYQYQYCIKNISSYCVILCITSHLYILFVWTKLCCCLLKMCKSFVIILLPVEWK